MSDADPDDATVVCWGSALNDGFAINEPLKVKWQSAGEFTDWPPLTPSKKEDES